VFGHFADLDHGDEIVTSPVDAPVSFARDIRPLFLASDRDSMTFAFDLWDVDDVRSNADAILERLQDGSMPCDRDWPQANIELFGRWIATGRKD
jgi:hypothetical protein